MPIDRVVTTLKPKSASSRSARCSPSSPPSRRTTR